MFSPPKLPPAQLCHTRGRIGTSAPQQSPHRPGQGTCCAATPDTIGILQTCSEVVAMALAQVKGTSAASSSVRGELLFKALSADDHLICFTAAAVVVLPAVVLPIRQMLRRQPVIHRTLCR